LSSSRYLKESLDIILENAPRHFALAGHSMGGWIAAEIMRLYPDRVTKFCLLDTAVDVDSIERKQQRLEMIRQVKLGHIEQVIDDIVQAFVHQKNVASDIKHMFLKNKHAFLFQEQMMLARETCMQFLPTLQLPSMLIVGRNDTIFYSQMCHIQKRLQCSKLAIIEECGHMSPMEAPQAVTALMRFWLEYL
jgi:pimeloyl-ACP methyl ester carboxylesterase